MVEVAVQTEFRSRFARCPDQVGAARRWTRPHVGRVANLDVVDLLVSELAANALKHTRSASVGFEVVVKVGGGMVRVEVVDAGAETEPVVRPASSIREGGRGMALLDALAAAWGHEPRGQGRAVWFEVPLAN